SATVPPGHPGPASPQDGTPSPDSPKEDPGARSSHRSRRLHHPAAARDPGRLRDHRRGDRGPVRRGLPAHGGARAAVLQPRRGLLDPRHPLLHPHRRPAVQREARRPGDRPGDPHRRPSARRRGDDQRAHQCDLRGHLRLRGRRRHRHRQGGHPVDEAPRVQRRLRHRGERLRLLAGRGAAPVHPDDPVRLGLRRLGYPGGYATALSASASSLGVVPPPSIPMILFASASGASVAAVFTAGIGAGLLAAVLLLIGCWLVAWKAGFPRVRAKLSVKRLLIDLLFATPAILIPIVLIRVVLFTGIATVTEVSVLAVLYALAVRVLLYRDLTLAQSKKGLVASGSASAVVLLLIMFSSALAWLLTIQ